MEDVQTCHVSIDTPIWNERNYSHNILRKFGFIDIFEPKVIAKQITHLRNEIELLMFFDEWKNIFWKWRINHEQEKSNYYRDFYILSEHAIIYRMLYWKKMHFWTFESMILRNPV